MKRFLLTALVLLAATRALAASAEFKLTDAKGAPVADAVVSLVPLDTPAKFSPPAEPLVIAQQGQEFIPTVTAIVVGTTVRFPNQDTVAHQVYSLSLPKKFALPLYKPGTAGTVTFDHPGVVALGCNIHDWMLAYVVILETPWFAVSHPTGTVTVSEVPPGRYRAEIWHARLGKPITQELTVAAVASTAPTAVTLTLKPERRIRRAPGATGGDYK